MGLKHVVDIYKDFTELNVVQIARMLQNDIYCPIAGYQKTLILVYKTCHMVKQG